MSENPVPQEQGATSLDFTGITIIGFGGAGIQRINGDNTPLQTLANALHGGLRINDLGGGIHTIEQIGLNDQSGTGVVPVTCPHGVPTVLLTLTIPYAGWWLIIANANLSNPRPAVASAFSTLRILNGAAAIGECTHQFGGSTSLFDGQSVTSYLVNYAGGETITMVLTQENSGLAAYDYNAVLTLLRIGNN